MKSNSGVTTTSLIVYIIAMMVVLSIIATITSFFYTNINNIDQSSKKTAQITKFNMYFLEEVKKEDNKIINITNNTISFSSGNTFSFQDNSIYFNKIVICKDVKNMNLSTERINDKDLINVLLIVGENIEYTKTTSYVLNSIM